MVAIRLNGYDRYQVPADCTRVTAMIDVHKRLLFYTVVAFNETFGGYVIDYGTWPRQTRSVFTLSDARPSLVDKWPNFDDEQLVFAGLSELVPLILERAYPRVGSGEHRITKCLIDSGWKGKAVYEFIRQSAFDPIIYPSKGVARSSSSVGVARWAKRDGERLGHHWRQTNGEHGRKQQIQFDPDEWKTILHGKLSVPMGGRSTLSFWGRDPKAHEHELIAQHCEAESSEPAMTKGDRYDKWTPAVGSPDNHLFDCLNGSLVAASVDGLVWDASGAPVAKNTGPRKTLREMREEKERTRGAT